MNQKFLDFMAKYHGKKIAVAVSGGVDSVCLLCWLKEIGADIVCLHVNHGLRAAADTESEYVRDLCAKLNVPCEIFRWSGDKPTTGIEAAARLARYKFMTDYCHAHGIEYLAVAHQADDQIETFLMNLARGSGLYGLAAMRGESVRDGIKIIRPLLGIYRHELRAWCDENHVKYFIDEMNDDTKYTRVKIRKNRHLLDEKLGISDARILLAIENLARTRRVLDDNVAELVSAVQCRGGAMFTDSFLFDQGAEIRLKFLGTLIQTIGGNYYQPRLESLTRALNQLMHDTQFTLGHCTIRRLRGQILIVPEGNKTSFRKRHGK